MEWGKEVGNDVAGLVQAYQDSSAYRVLSQHTRRAYLRHVREFLRFLVQLGQGEDLLRDDSARCLALRNYRDELLVRRGLKPSTANQALAAVDHLFRFLGGDRPPLPRAELVTPERRVLTADEVQRFVSVLHACRAARDRALGMLFLDSGLRVSEVAALNLKDIRIQPRRGPVAVAVHYGRGGEPREVLVEPLASAALSAWLRVRERVETTSPALFLSRDTGRMTVRAIDLVLRRLGRVAGVEISAQVLRNTYLANQARRVKDLKSLADLAGHRNPESTRRYVRALSRSEKAM